jgi:hypothetical protein
MSTIYEPIRPDGRLTREEALANTEVVYPPREAPLTNEQLNEIRAKAQKPDSHSARLAKQIAEQAERRAESLADRHRQHDDWIRVSRQRDTMRSTPA